MIRIIANISLIAKGPVTEVILDSAPQAVEPSGFEQQEQNDDEADRGDLERRKLIGEERRGVADRIGERGQQRRNQHDEGGAIDRAGDAAQSADDDHADVLDRDLSLIHISEPTRLLSISYA